MCCCNFNRNTRWQILMANVDFRGGLEIPILRTTVLINITNSIPHVRTNLIQDTQVKWHCAVEALSGQTVWWLMLGGWHIANVHNKYNRLLKVISMLMMWDDENRLGTVSSFVFGLCCYIKSYETVESSPDRQCHGGPVQESVWNTSFQMNRNLFGGLKYPLEIWNLVGTHILHWSIWLRHQFSWGGKDDGRGFRRYIWPQALRAVCRGWHGSCQSLRKSTKFVIHFVNKR